MPTTTLTPIMTKELFTYRDGVLFWKTRPAHHFKNPKACKAWNSRYSGKEAGCKAGSGYLSVRVTIGDHKKLFDVHRLIWAWHHERWPKGQLDHIDHNKQNNRIENLREVSRSENCKNRSFRVTNSSGRTGVYWHKRSKKWTAIIVSNGIRKHLGYFSRFEDAVDAREVAEKHHKFHKNHGRVAS